MKNMKENNDEKNENERPRDLLDLLSNKTGIKAIGDTPETTKIEIPKRGDGWDEL